jgi:hypothetical protein
MLGFDRRKIKLSRLKKLSRAGFTGAENGRYILVRIKLSGFERKNCDKLFAHTKVYTLNINPNRHMPSLLDV